MRDRQATRVARWAVGFRKEIKEVGEFRRLKFPIGGFALGTTQTGGRKDRTEAILAAHYGGVLEGFK